MSTTKRQQAVETIAYGTIQSKPTHPICASDVKAYLAGLDRYSWVREFYSNPKLSARQRDNLISSALERIDSLQAELAERQRENEQRLAYEQNKEKNIQLAMDAWIAGIEQLESKSGAYNEMFNILYGYRANHGKSEALDRAVKHALTHSK